MIQIDLITGFLGAGKTTFLRRYAGYLLDSGMHIGIIENDFGAINVDRLLLRDLEEKYGERCEIEQIVGGNVVADWKRRFRSKLIAMSMRGVDRVLVEPSGIYDTDTFFDVLYDDPLPALYEIGNIITIVESAPTQALSPEAEYLLATQLAHSGKIVLSRLSAEGDGAHDSERGNAEATATTRGALTALLQKYDCPRTLDGCLLAKPWDALTDEDYNEILHCGWSRTGCKAPQPVAGAAECDGFTPLFFMNMDIPADRIRPCAEALLHTPSLGSVYRVKGFFAQADGSWLQLNATPAQCSVTPADAGQKVVIVIGEGLDKDKIEATIGNFAATE